MTTRLTASIKKKGHENKMKTAKIKNRQKRSMLGVTVILLLLMTLTAGIFTGCGKNAGGGVDGTESSGTNADGSTGSGKGRFIESKVALPEEINSILQFKALSDGTLEVVGQDADYSIYVVKSSDGGGSWETTPLEDISYSNVAVAEDGTVAFLDYTENGLCPVTIVDADGSTHTFSIEMPAEDAFVSVAAFDSNKQLIVRDTEGGLYGIDCTDGSKTVTFEIDEDTYIPYFDVVGTNCYIVTSPSEAFTSSTTSLISVKIPFSTQLSTGIPSKISTSGPFPAGFRYAASGGQYFPSGVCRYLCKP
jgi:hypothetical protein